MKLVDILARELKEWVSDWPAMGQAEDGTLHREPFLGGHTSFSLTRASDYVQAIVTRAQWKEAREALSKPVNGTPMPPISEAPKDATHWDPGINCTATWAMKCDGVWYWHPADGEAIENGWRPYSNVSPATLNFIRIERPWTGEGLPPVGTECEFKQNLLGWVKATITAITDKSIVFTRPIYRRAEITGVHEELLPHKAIERFRPIRTPEQIAAEERNAILAEMQRAVDCGSHGPQITLQNTLMNLYDAGYRKVKDGNQTA